MVGVNVMDAFWGAKHATRVMIPKKNGCILFTSSATTNVAGLSTHSYASSKCAVLGLVRNLAVGRAWETWYYSQLRRPLHCGHWDFRG